MVLGTKLAKIIDHPFSLALFFDFNTTCFWLRNVVNLHRDIEGRPWRPFFVVFRVFLIVRNSPGLVFSRPSFVFSRLGFVFPKLGSRFSKPPLTPMEVKYVNAKSPLCGLIVKRGIWHQRGALETLISVISNQKLINNKQENE